MNESKDSEVGAVFKQYKNADGGRYLVQQARNGEECYQIAKNKTSHSKRARKCLELYIEYANDYLTVSYMAGELGVNRFFLSGHIAKGKKIWESVEWHK